MGPPPEVAEALKAKQAAGSTNIKVKEEQGATRGGANPSDEFNLYLNNWD